MKRSEINRALRWAEELLDAHGWKLPDMAYWDMAKWKANADRLDVVRRVMLGWDITDFGQGAFDRLGAVLYTVRNGLVEDPAVGVPYCEKLILMKAGQRLPLHYHVYKTEDIINRRGGTLALVLWNCDAAGRRMETPVQVRMDGFLQRAAPGEPLLVSPGNSVTIPPYLAHIFGPAEGSGDLIVGEVSRVNDDTTDNYFLEPTARFSEIEEDEAIFRPLCNELHRI